MKTGTIVALVILAIVLFFTLSLVGCGVGKYNTLVSQDEQANSAWSQVENQYQRRYDLIPNLVEIVKGYAKHEKDVFVEVATARASVGSVKLTPELLKNPAALEAFQKVQDGLSSVLSRLMMVTEKYPELQANKNFLDLQKQLEGTENRISTERKRFNEVVQVYNVNVRQFPGSVVASITGFKERPYFKSEQGANKAPKVRF